MLALGQVGADDDDAPGRADRLGEDAQALATVVHDPPALGVAQLAGAEERAPRRRRRGHDPASGVDDLDDVADLPGGQRGRAQQRGGVAAARDGGDVMGAQRQRVVDALVDPRSGVQEQEDAHDGQHEGHDARVGERQPDPQGQRAQDLLGGAHSR